MNKEIIETLTKVNNFIEANKNVNYKIRLLEREVPNIGELVEKLNLQNVSVPKGTVCRLCKAENIKLIDGLCYGCKCLKV